VGPAEQHRVAVAARVGGDREGVAGGLRRDPAHGGRRDPGRVDEQHDGRLRGGAGQRREAGAQRRSDTFRPAGVLDDERVPQHGDAADLGSGGTEHDDERVAAAVAEHVESEVHPAPAVALGQRLRHAVPAPLAGGQHQPRSFHASIIRGRR
jgi:hypothetical protein